MRRSIIFALLVAGVSACSDGPKEVPNNLASQLPDADTDPGSATEIPDESDANQSASVRSAASSSAPIPLRDDWIGRWIGVEGLNLTITKTATAGRYSLKMQYGTDTGSAGIFEGVATAEGISFTRPDGKHVLRAATGDQTGLKYLAGKTDCLKVQDGEGYCRS